MNNQIIKNQKEHDFIKEIAKYFMDFLETDFHKRRNPRRSVKYKNNDNLLVGTNLTKYKKFTKQVSAQIKNGFNNNTMQISKGTYKTDLPKGLLDLIKLKINKIADKDIQNIIKQISDNIENLATLHAKQYDIALSNSIDKTSEIIENDLVSPFIRDIEEPLQNMELGDQDRIYMIQEELTSVLTRLLDDKISELINPIIAKNVINIQTEIQSVFKIEDVKHNLINFFESLRLTDLFAELQELERNKDILDKQDYYLYFGDIYFNNNKYPIFYIPFNLISNKDTVIIEFDSQVYINKKALEFVVQEFNNTQGSKGNLNQISDRILYLFNQDTKFIDTVEIILNEIKNFFDLKGEIDLSNPNLQISKNNLVRISNNKYICLFDKSDEALVNDYEDISKLLTEEDSHLSQMFSKLIDDFIHKNPDPFNPEIEKEWDKSETSDKLVYPSPVPINSEQRQILSALNNDKCKYLIVSGPPGTGKSHTITAIIFEAVLKNQSVLVLSDKKEALDVVEDKITETINKIRGKENFQNPILRLGKTGNTYNSILAKDSIDSMKNHVRARNNNALIDDSINEATSKLKNDLNDEFLNYSNININEIKEYLLLEQEFNNDNFIFDKNEYLNNKQNELNIEYIRESLLYIKSILESKETKNLFELLKIDFQNIQTFEEYQKKLEFLKLIQDHYYRIVRMYKYANTKIKKFQNLNSKDLPIINDYIKKYLELKNWGVGYFFNKSKIEKLNYEFQTDFINNSFVNPHEQLDELKAISSMLSYILDSTRNINKQEIDLINIFHIFSLNNDFINTVDDIQNLNNNFKDIQQFQSENPQTSKKIKINFNKFSSLLQNPLTLLEEKMLDNQIQHLELFEKIQNDFSSLSHINYSTKMEEIEELVTTQVTSKLDKSVVDFYVNNRNDAITIRAIIKNKLKFPKNDFIKLKSAFPCILAGIRDYAEYIPLEPELFDLVIIDEASQVSIAQAFPALLRAKKVLILGDKKQFSNIKSAQARGETNRAYLNKLNDNFKLNISSDIAKLSRMNKFNIKTSILDFFEHISNYDIELKKHFRGYKELISYSNKYFYNDSLQVMKIRGKSINDVIEFSYIENDSSKEVYPKTNSGEVEFIISELLKLKSQQSTLSVGIITPHTNQQKLLVNEISKLQEYAYFKEKFKLKIMTFDTCQGEERDIIYYSMVADDDSDKLGYVFIKDLNKVDIEEVDQVRAQRLNVGFSRAKEKIHFVLSKKLENYSGSIGEAIRHYKFIFDQADKEHSVDDVDPNSKMEPKVLNWFYQTSFWKENHECIAFTPQFPIGEYLKQLDNSYSRPLYVVDFLLVYKDKSNKYHNIVIEYDGFEEHFNTDENINEFNWEHYQNEDDRYRQKILEGYGYKFLRINKFNSGENPIEFIDSAINSLLYKSKKKI